MTIRVKIRIQTSYTGSIDGWVVCSIKNSESKVYKRVHQHPLGSFFEFPTYYYFTIPRKVKIELLEGELKANNVVGEISPIKFTKLIKLQPLERVITYNDSRITFTIRMEEDFDRAVKKNDYTKHSYLELVKMLPTLSTMEKKYKTEYSISCSAKNLAKKDFFSKSDPFFHFRCGNPEFYLFSGVIMNNLNPKWPSFNSTFNGRLEMKSLFHVNMRDYDKNNSGGELIGEVEISFGDVVEGKKEFDLYDDKNKKSGTFIIDEFITKEICEDFNPNESALKLVENAIAIRVHECFYLLQKDKGLKLEVSIAIDFSLSNGHFDSPESLHYIFEEKKKNPYKKVISKVLKTLKPFVYANKYHGYGYGAKLNNQDETLPFFNLSLSDKEEFESVHQVVNAYKQAIPQLTFTSMESVKNPKTGQPYHANDFYSIIDHVSQKANPESYNILVIITTGKDVDIQSTINSIVESSDKPLSIILVGVGAGDFSALTTLDADRKVLVHSNGNSLNRDVVQFVNFNKTTNLVLDVLKEIPENFVKCFLERLPAQ